MPQVRFAWIGEAWRLFLARKAVWLAVAAFQIGIASLLALVTAFFIGANDHSPPSPSDGPWLDFLEGTAAYDIVAGLCYLLVSAVLSGAAHRLAVRQVRGESIGFRDLFRAWDIFFPSFGYALVGGLIQTVGWLLCLLPGLVLTGLLLPVPAQIADGEAPWSALSTSFQALGRDWGHAMTLTLLLCLLILVALAPYLLGFLVIQPLLWLVAALAYRDMIDLPRTMPPPLPDYGPAQPGVWPPPPTFGSPPV